MDSLQARLETKIMVLNERLWENRLPYPAIQAWLRNFDGRIAGVESERLHALYWLSNFMYFGSREIRVLIRSLFRDLYLRPLIREVRDNIGSSVSDEELHSEVELEIERTRFFGLGNPSESGVHLLYYYRQENSLSKEHFMDAVRIFSRGSDQGRVLRKPEIKRYVFLDDICGSGDTAIDYSKEVLSGIKALDANAAFAYHCLFATRSGLSTVRQGSLFGENCAAVYELDETYRCLSPQSRYFNEEYPEIDKDLACRVAREYGNLLNPSYATGWKDGQMLMGFHHNTPDNTLALIWYDSSWGGDLPWQPAFKRYPKV